MRILFICILISVFFACTKDNVVDSKENGKQEQLKSSDANFENFSSKFQFPTEEEQNIFMEMIKENEEEYKDKEDYYYEKEDYIKSMIESIDEKKPVKLPVPQ